MRTDPMRTDPMRTDPMELVKDAIDKKLEDGRSFHLDFDFDLRPDLGKTIRIELDVHREGAFTIMIIRDRTIGCGTMSRLEGDRFLAEWIKRSVVAAFDRYAIHYYPDESGLPYPEIPYPIRLSFLEHIMS